MTRNHLLQILGSSVAFFLITVGIAYAVPALPNGPETSRVQAQVLLTATLTPIPPTITPIPNIPPDCSSASVSPDNLWPPNHRVVWISVVGVTDPDGDSVSIAFSSIFQDEPVNGTGDGDTALDGFIITGTIALVRAERAEPGNGRVYHIEFAADDGNGGTCSGSATVGVLNSMGKNGGAVDDGAVYNSLLVP